LTKLDGKKLYFLTSRRIYQNTSKTTGLCPIFTLTSAVPVKDLSFCKIRS